MPNSTKIALAAVLVLAVLVLWSRATLTSNELEGRERRVFVSFVRNRVDEIAIQRGAESYRLQRQRGSSDLESGDFVLVRGNEQFDADADRVSMLFSAFEYAEPVRELGDNAPSHAGLDSPHARVRGSFRVGQLRVPFVLGAPEVRGEGAYLRVQERVVVAATDFVEALDHPSEYYEPAPSDAGAADIGAD